MGILEYCKRYFKRDKIMKCHIGFRSDFATKYPSLVYEKGWNDTTGLSIRKYNEAWVFVDRITFLNQYRGLIIAAITRTTIHELIHLCGGNEDAAYAGSYLVREHEKEVRSNN